MTMNPGTRKTKSRKIGCRHGIQRHESTSMDKGLCWEADRGECEKPGRFWNLSCLKLNQAAIETAEEGGGAQQWQNYLEPH
jgi:hypothetical protein